MMARGNTRETKNQARVQYLEQLLKDHRRQQTIQDVGFWLIEYPLEPLPPRLIKVLRQWLKEHNNLTIKQNRRGSPHSDTRDEFPLITRMHQDTGMSIEAACLMIVEQLNLEIDPTNLRRAYDRARTPLARFLDDSVKALGAFNKSGTPAIDIEKAKTRFEAKAKKPARDTKNRKIRTQKPE
jgi:hypothetical protein